MSHDNRPFYAHFHMMLHNLTVPRLRATNKYFLKVTTAERFKLNRDPRDGWSKRRNTPQLDVPELRRRSTILISSQLII
jgi:hypothetical protein